MELSGMRSKQTSLEKLENIWQFVTNLWMDSSKWENSQAIALVYISQWTLIGNVNHFNRLFSCSHAQTRMEILENHPHSAGAIYYAINNLPHDQCFLQVNIIYASVIPGPKELNVQQINHCLELTTKELMELQHGKWHYTNHSVIYNFYLSILNLKALRWTYSKEIELTLKMFSMEMVRPMFFLTVRSSIVICL